MANGLTASSKAFAPVTDASGTTCPFFRRGFCRKGVVCHLPHDRQDLVEVCKFFAGGWCSRGDVCSFAHAHAAGTREDVQPLLQIPCGALASGKCDRGKECVFSHSHRQAWTACGNSQKGELMDDIGEECTREFPGAWVTFGAGGCVKKLVLPTDSSTAEISGLPVTAGEHVVRQLLEELELLLPDVKIRISLGEDGYANRVLVTAGGPDFASKLCNKLNTGFTIRNLNGIDMGQMQVYPVTMPLPFQPRGFSHHVTCKTIFLKWPQPKTRVRLKFALENTARQAANGFRNGKHTVLGVRAAEVHLLPATRAGAWCVELLVHPEASAQDVVETMASHRKPFSTELEGGTEGYGTGTEWIEQQLASFGPLSARLERFSSRGDVMLGSARFEREEDALGAVNGLDGAEPVYTARESDAGGGKQKITAVAVYTATFRTGVQRLAEAWPKLRELVVVYGSLARPVSFEFHPPADRQRFVALRLVGENFQAVYAAQRDVDALFRGGRDVQRGGGAAAASGPVAPMGPVTPPHSPLAAPKFFPAADGGCQPCNVVPLDTPAFEWAFHGGAHAIAQAVGFASVRLVTGSKKYLLVVGPERAYRRTVKLVAQRAEVAYMPLGLDSWVPLRRGLCRLCGGMAKEPLAARCGHEFCLECFEAFASSGVRFEHRDGGGGGGGGRAVECPVGVDGERCGHVFGLRELQELLSSVAFEEVLAAALGAHFAANVGVYWRCPTEGCTQICRARGDGFVGLLMCPACLVPFADLALSEGSDS
ncbi:putative cleavage and polyadenylation specificity factor subunit 4-like protein [Colletotrichum sidae]|uniref:Putative cleavage and polyadenylation specificity factor subunit 4-like protein n=1 Tax=Colletotrichum sidae TaxID=1347389 RepID=A0A4R8TQ48_9PEZI|nr:putative cleavage and polyadenylation specificity factor subunit 4-like protein [Colletotrichum sidae]